MDYDEIREEAKLRGCSVKELLALTVNSDPFYAGMPSRRRNGEWFTALWDHLGRPRGAHLRRLHYLLVSEPTPPLRPDGAPYVNTYDNWMLLNGASREARYLGLVDPTALEDHRSAPPALFAGSRPTPAPAWDVSGLGRWEDPPSLPWIETDVSWDSDLSMPRPTVSGYDYDDAADQPFHLEVWIEKSTMTDILEPICRRHGIDLVVGVGYLSVTRVVEMLRRVADHGKPARIFYISDFDPSGEGMPIQVARQSEFWLPDRAADADLKLEPLVLTAEQARQYGLPRAPIKEGNKQKDDFESRHGEGAVELDALEALYPGELGRLVREAIEPYIDRELPRRLGRARLDADQRIKTAWEAATEGERAELAAIRAEARTVAATYREELEQIAARLDEDMAPLRDRLSVTWQALRVKLRSLAVPLPDRPESDLEPPDSEDDWLFDAARPYDEQLSYYKERRPGPTGDVTLHPDRACEICGASFRAARRNHSVCSKACQAKRSHAIASERTRAARAALPALRCAVCGEPFTSQRRSARYCSPTCQQVERNRAKVERKMAARRSA
jgi:hypothetical protein